MATRELAIPRVQTTFRLPVELYAALVRRAADDGTSVNMLAIIYLCRGLDGNA